MQELGIEVVTSDGEVHQIVRKGVPFYEDSCFPLKLLIPHSQSLVGKVDALFLPRLISLDGHYILCPKFRGAPDVLKLAVKDALKLATLAEKPRSWRCVSIYKRRVKL